MTYYAIIIIVISVLIMVLDYGVFNSYGIFLKPLLTYYGWSRAAISGAFSLAWIMQGALSPLMGRLTDKFGPRFVITLCGILLGSGFAAMAIISAIWQLYLFLGIIIGIGMSAINVSLLSTIVRWFISRRGIVTGIVMAGGGIGGIIFPPLASYLIAEYDWQTTYLILGITVLVIMLICAFFLKRDPQQIGQKPYINNSIDIRTTVPSEDKYTLSSAIATKQFWLITTELFILGFCAYSIIVHVVIYATDLGIGEMRAANILAICSFSVIFGRVFIGHIADKIGYKKTFGIGFILLTISFVILLLANNISMFFIVAVIFGFSWGLGVLASPLVATLFGLKIHGTVLGFVNLGYSLGAALGPLLTGYIFDVTGSYFLAFIVNTALCVICLFIIRFITSEK